MISINGSSRIPTKKKSKGFLSGERGGGKGVGASLQRSGNLALGKVQTMSPQDNIILESF